MITLCYTQIHLTMLLLLILFLIASFFCFSIPGIFLLTKSKIQFSFWEKIILGTIVGFTAFTLLSYLLLLVKMQVLLLPIIFFISIISFRQILKLKNQITLFTKKRLAVLCVIFLVGITGQLLVIAPSGLNLNGDLIFWSSHAHDGSWHISLVEEIKKGYPLQNPVYAGEKLVNYHFFSDLAPAVFNQYFKFSALDLYFRFFPLLFSTLLGAIVYLLGAKLGGFAAGAWSLIFTYFAGSFGYIVTYINNQTIGGESIFWASQIQSSIGNPPQIASFVIILTFMYLFQNFIVKKDKVLFLILVLLAGTLVEFKVYGAVVLLISLGILGLWQVVKERKVHILLLSLLSGLLSAIIYLPNSSNTGAFLIFEPWWFIRTMVVAPDRLNWIDLELRRQTYIFENNWKRVIQVELTAFLIFLFGNLGMRFLGLWELFRLSKSFFVNYFNQLFLLIIIISFILPLLFLQKGVATNTIQFLQYFLVLFGILAALTINEIFKKIKFKFLDFLLGLMIILLSIPTQLALINSFYNRLPFTRIDKEELLALKFLKENVSNDSIILTPPYDKYLNLNDPIPHIWDWFDTSYIPAISGKRVYLSDTEQVDIMGYNLNKRLEVQKLIFTTEDPQRFMKEIKNNNISYLYFPKVLKPKIDFEKLNFENIFTNSLIEIWRVKNFKDAFLQLD